MKFLIAGFGSIGRRHFRNLLALGERDITLYRTHRSALPDDELAGFPVETDLQAALAHKPDAVIVANPTALHLDVAIPAAEAGCHLLLEKPVSHSLERADKLEAAVHRGGGKVLVGFQYRFHPGLQWIADCGLRSAANPSSESHHPDSPIGRPLSARAVYAEYLPGWHPWEDYRRGYSARADLGGGVILTLCHPLDILCWLLGEVEAVWAFAGRLGDLELEVEDIAEIGLRFASGVLGSVHLDYNRQPPAHTLEIVGTRGVILWDSADGTARLFFPSSHEGRLPSPSGRGAGGEGPPPGFERNDMFLAEMRHFLAIVRGETESACSLQDGVRSLRLAMAAHASQQTGQLIPLVL